MLQQKNQTSQLNRIMSKNILSKFRKSLEESSKIVHNSRSSILNRHSSHGVSEQKEIEYIRQHTDRSEMSSSRVSNADNKRLLSKIPVLVNQNDDLKERIKRLQGQIKELRKEKQLKNSIQEVAKMKAYFEKDVESTKERLYKSKIRAFQPNLRLYQSSRESGLRSKHMRDFSLSPRTEQKKIDFTILQSGLVTFLQKQIEGLRQQNQELKAKYNRILADKNNNSSDIDLIQLNFLATIANQQQNFNNKEHYYEQKIKVLQNRISQLQQENQVAKLKLNALSQKLSTYEKTITKQQQRYKVPILSYKSKCVQEKQGFAPNVQINYFTTNKKDPSQQEKYFDPPHQRRFR